MKTIQHVNNTNTKMVRDERWQETDGLNKKKEKKEAINQNAHFINSINIKKMVEVNQSHHTFFSNYTI